MKLRSFKCHVDGRNGVSEYFVQQIPHDFIFFFYDEYGILDISNSEHSPPYCNILFLFFILFAVHYAAMLKFKIKLFFKFATELHVSAYSAIARGGEIRGNCCAFRATVISVFVFTMVLHEVNVIPPSSKGRLHISDTYIDAYNLIFETLHQIAAHTFQSHI
jgi:hypothetical protein